MPLPTNNSDLQQLAQLFSLFQSDPHQGQNAFNYAQLAQQKQAHEAEQQFRMQQLAQQGQHFNAEAAYRNKALEQANVHNQLQSTYQLAGLGQAAKAEEDRAQRETLNQQLTSTWHMAGLGQAAKTEEDRAQREALQNQLATTWHMAEMGQRGQMESDRLEAQKQERMATVNGTLLSHFMSQGGDPFSQKGLAFAQGISPDVHANMVQGAAQNVAQKETDILNQYLLAHNLKPTKTTLELVNGQMGKMGSLANPVQQFIPWDDLNQRMKSGGQHTGSSDYDITTGPDADKVAQILALKQKGDAQDAAELATARARHAIEQQDAELKRQKARTAGFWETLGNAFPSN